MDSGRPVRISASPRTAWRLVGFPEALARLSGTRQGALRARPAFLAACAAIADPAETGPVRLRAVREGRRTVGHAPADDGAVRRLAAACLRHRSAEGVLEGPLATNVARLAGIRAAARRRWSREPALDARAQVAVDAVHLWFGVRTLVAPPGAAWVSALVVPRLARLAAPSCGETEPARAPAAAEDVFGDGDADFGDVGDPFPPGRQAAPEWAAVEEGHATPAPLRPFPYPGLGDGYARRLSVVALLATPDTRTAVIAELPDSRVAAATQEGEESGLADRIDAALAAFDPLGPQAAPPRVETGFEDGAAAAMLALAGHACLPPTLGARLAAAVPFQLSRRAWSASAVFRRTLPATLRDIAGLVGHQFDGTHQATCFLRLHQGSTAEDGRRILETLRLMGCLRPFHDNPRMLDAIRRGASLDDVLGIAVGHPVHRKTVRSMRARFQYRKLNDAASDVTRLCTHLDAYFASDPHLPILDAKQLHAASHVSRMLWHMPHTHRGENGTLAATVLRAHRDERGRLRSPAHGQEDLFRWLVDRCRVAFGKRRRDRRDYGMPEIHVRQALAILYPPQRRHAALERLVAAWHGDVVRLTHEHDILVAELRTARRRGPATVADFPHLAGDPVSFGDVRITPLIGPEAIAAEGRDLQHCIGTYVGRAATGSCMLLGFASGSGRSSAEVVPEVSTGAKSGHLSVRQHYGPRNAPPPDDHRQALGAWISAMDPKAVFVAAKRAAEASRINHDAYDPYAGIGTQGRERIAKLCRDQLAPYLSGALKSATLADWSAL